MGGLFDYCVIPGSVRWAREWPIATDLERQQTTQPHLQSAFTGKLWNCLGSHRAAGNGLDEYVPPNPGCGWRFADAGVVRRPAYSQDCR